LSASVTEIIAHKNARENLIRNKMPGVPRITFSEETELTLGGKTVAARYFGRGHTNGDVMVYFAADKVLHAGDLFIAGPPYADYNNGASMKEWPQTLDRALNSPWEFDTVIPGHGAVSKREDLIKFRDTVEAVRDQSAALVRQGKGKDELSAMLTRKFGFQPNTNAMRGVDAMMAELK
jgi:cyclase